MKVRTKSGTIYWLHNINGKLRCFTLSGAERKVTKEMKELVGGKQNDITRTKGPCLKIVQTSKNKVS